MTATDLALAATFVALPFALPGLFLLFVWLFGLAVGVCG